MFNDFYVKVSVVILRISLGWLMFYAGLTKIINPDWTAAGYLKSAKTFSGVYNWMASPGIIEIINFINAWGLTLLGISLILGLLVRISSPLGAVLMLLYYIPILEFPYIDTHSFLVDEHIIYILVLIFFAAANVGTVYGLDGKLKKLFFFKETA